MCYGFRLTLPTGIVDVPGVVGVGVISRWVYPWLVVFYCVVLLVGSHVMPMVDNRGLGHKVPLSRFRILSFGASFSFCVASQ